MKRIISSIFCFIVLLTSLVEAGYPDFPLGPIGGTFLLETGSPFIRITSIEPNSPGATAGLQVNDSIAGVDGRMFTPTGSEFQGAARQLGWAIEQAEATDGVLALDIIRPGVGKMTVNVQLPAVGGLSPAFPLNSTKWDNVYEQCCKDLNTRLIENNGDIAYLTGWAGLALLASPHWNETTGDTPFRLGINKVYDNFKGRINQVIYAPVERKFFNHQDNPNYENESFYLENWTLGLASMFMAEYYSKTNEAEALTLLQTITEKLSNRVQWWRQPNGNDNLEYTMLRPGCIGHDGVMGDYMAGTFAGGINIVGVHVTGGLVMAKRAGADFTVRPVDGRYWGYDPRYFNDDEEDGFPSSDLPAGITPPNDDDGNPLPFLPETLVDGTQVEWDTKPSIQDKLEFAWEFYKLSQSDTGHITYSPGAGSYHDSGGRTAGVLFTGCYMLDDDEAFEGDNLEMFNLLKSYHDKHYDIHLNAHVSNMQSVAFYQLASGRLNTRNRQHFLDNWRFFYNLMRNPSGGVTFMRGRGYGGISGNHQDIANIYFALFKGVASGGLDLVDGYDTDDLRLVDFSKIPHIEWKDLEKRTLTLYSPDVSFDLEVTDGAGAPTTDYTASWTVTSSPNGSQVTFSDASALDTDINFSMPGDYDLLLTVQSQDGTITTTEPIQIKVFPAASDSSYTVGKAIYRVYSDINGGDVSNILNSPKYPDSPDQQYFVSEINRGFSYGNFGATTTTTIVAPETGDYTFYLSSDDASSLYFNSTGADPSGAVKIASVSVWTVPGQWDKYETQKSATFHLTKGQHYYLQVIHKSLGGGNFLELAWTRPSNSNLEFIKDIHMAAPQPALAFSKQPEDLVQEIGDPITFTVNTENSEHKLFQWRHNGVNYGLPSSSNKLVINNPSAYLAGTWDVVCTTESAVVTSNTATLTLTNLGNIHNNVLYYEAYYGIGGNQISDLTSSSVFPESPGSSGLTEPHLTPNTEADEDSGRRLTGWFIPDETTNYRFFVSGDDRVALYLSTDSSSANKQLLVETSHYTADMDWHLDRCSAWQPLIAGKRYYIEFLHKEARGESHMAFTWQKEGEPEPVNGQMNAPYHFLQSVEGGNAAPEPAENSVSITRLSSRVMETSPAGITYQIKRGGDLSQPLTVYLDASGTAEKGVDFMMPDFVTIPANENLVEFTLNPINDYEEEELESVTVSILPDPSYTLGFYLAPEVYISDGVRIVSQPVDLWSVTGSTASFTFEVDDPFQELHQTALYQLRHNGQNYGSPSTSSTLYIYNVDPSLSGGWDVVYTTDNTIIVSDPVTLTINDSYIIKQQTFDGLIFKSVAEGAIFDGAESGDTFFDRTQNAPVTHTSTSDLDLGFTHDGKTSTSSGGGTAGVIAGALQLSHYSSTYSGSDLYQADSNFFTDPQNADIVFDAVDLSSYQNKSFSIDLSELGSPDYDDDVVIRLKIDGNDTTIFDTRDGLTGALDAGDAKNGAVFDGTTLTYSFQDSVQSAQLLVDILTDDANDGYALDNVLFKGLPKSVTIASQDFEKDIFKTVAEGAASDGAESGDSFFNNTVTHTSTGSDDVGFIHDGLTSTTQGGVAGVVNGKLQLIHYSSNSDRSDLDRANPNFFTTSTTGDLIFDPVTLTGYVNKEFSMDLSNLGSPDGNDDIYVRLNIDGEDVTILDTRSDPDGTLDASDALNGAIYDGTTLSYNFPQSATSVQLIIDLMADDPGDGYSFDNIQFKGDLSPVSQTPPASLSYEQWRFAQWGSTNLPANTESDHDYDGDGMDNLAEFFFNLNPKNTQSMPVDVLPSMQLQSGVPTLHYKRLKNTNLTVQYEYSTDLETWNPLIQDAPNGYSITITPKGDYEQVEVQLKGDKIKDDRSFIRMEISN